MANVSNAINMSFRVDKELKKQADTLFKKLGMNTSVAINMFLSQSVREGGIPFMVTTQSPEPSNNLKEALKELKDYEDGKIKLKGYDNMEDLVNALEED